ncbi:hypothetical protein [Streptomyces sp. NPDC087300]|uniref:hypothetical protein n=1 Tax=Streptomyces sp. NPDC087300 TaxID=3365780 RepID=UPI0038167DE9
MMIVLLGVVVLVAAAGVGSVVWSARGGPRWVGGAARVTLAIADLIAAAHKRKRRSSGWGAGPSGEG